MVCWQWLAGLGAEVVAEVEVVDIIITTIRGSNGIRRLLNTRTTTTEPQSAKAPALAPVQFPLR